MRIRTKLALALLPVASVAAWAELSGSYLVPLDHDAIQYGKRPVSDPAFKLGERIKLGEVKLKFDSAQGYLASVLEELKIPQESQVMVFSKTSFQAPRISPRLPRAIYFNESISVGYVRGSDVLEIASVDPKLGVIFYTMDQEKVDKPRFDRRDTACLQCHQSGGTLGIPGIVVRSVYPEPSGMPMFQAGTFVTDHRSPLKERWGGWYVTGTHGKQTHMGNAVVRDRDRPDQLEGEAAFNVKDLSGKFDIGAYLTPHSDIVALMTLEHQTHMTNLFIRVGFETLLALDYQAGLNKAFKQPATEVSESTTRRINSAVEELLQYMLFVDETPLAEPVKGNTAFAAKFMQAGVRDSTGRSLRDFDLQKRMFRYPLSFMIYTDAFDGLPPAAKDRFYQRLHEVLTGRDSNPKYARITSADREAVLEILHATKKDLPGYYRTAEN